MSIDERWGLQCRILSDDPHYVHGWEAGLLWCRMAGRSVQEPPEESRIKQTIHSVSDEQVVVMAGVTGWHVVSLDRVDDTWSELVLERRAK